MRLMHSCPIRDVPSCLFTTYTCPRTLHLCDACPHMSEIRFPQNALHELSARNSNATRIRPGEKQPHVASRCIETTMKHPTDSASTESQNPALTGRHRSVVGRPAEPEIEPRPTRGGPILHWVHIVRFGHFGVPSGLPRGSENHKNRV